MSQTLTPTTEKPYLGRRVKVSNDYIQSNRRNKIGIIIDQTTTNSIFEIRLEDGSGTCVPNSPFHINPECEFVYLTKDEIIANSYWVTIIRSPKLLTWRDGERAIGHTFRLDIGWINRPCNEKFFINEIAYGMSNFILNVSIESLRLATRDEINLALSQQVNRPAPERRGRGSRPTRQVREELEAGPRILGKIDLSMNCPDPINPKTTLPIYNGFKQEVLDTILNKPTHLSVLKATSTNRKYYDKVINSFLPYKVGIEIECCDSLSSALSKNEEQMKSLLNCIDYSDDECAGESAFCEHRICFNGHKQLMSIYNLTLLLQKHCSINSQAGIHYHFDIPEIKGINNWDYGKIDTIRPLQTTCAKYLDEIDNILKYKGSYNKKVVKINEREGWINIQTEFNTIEIRTSAPKFDYKEIITEIILLSKVITKIRNEMKYPEYKLS